MNIAIVGFGKMGQAIEKIAISKGHKISFRITQENTHQIKEVSPENTDVAIEFTRPENAFGNIKLLIENDVSVVSGTTGWLQRKPELETLVREKMVLFFMLPILALVSIYFFTLIRFWRT